MHKKNPAPVEALSHRIEQAKQFIETNYYRDISLDVIAAAAHLSKAHLTRKFKETYQLTPHQYLVEVRLKQAIALLKQRICQ